MSIREMRWDTPKSLAQIKKELGRCCSQKGCNKPLTNMQGPHSESLCREHQLASTEWGGYGRPSRPHTFHRSDVCDCCKQDINDDPRWALAQEYFGVVLTERQKNEIKRRYNHGDHEFRKADGGDDSEENINAYCTLCHWIKSAIHNDSRRADKAGDLDE